MKNKKINYKLMLGVAVLGILGIGLASNFLKENEPSNQYKFEEVRQEEKQKKQYEEVQSSYKETDTGEEVALNLTGAKDTNGNGVKLMEYGGEKGILWNQKGSSYEMDFECEQGVYAIQFTYLPMKESELDIVANIQMDHQTLFEEMEAVELPRSWVAESENFYDEKGNEYAGYLTQEETLMIEMMRDREGLYSEPMYVELGKGEHTLNLQYVSGTMLLVDVKLIPKKEVQTYKSYCAKEKGTEYEGENIILQAENATSRSSRDIPSYMHNDASMTPYEAGKKRINAIGGNYWYEGNSSIHWKVNIPEDGYYKLAMRYIQSNENLISYRQILIDGEVPFEEIKEYPFSYTDKFKTVEIGGETPYLFYLTKGEHTLTMRAVTGEMKEIVLQLENLGAAIGLLVSDIQTITGTSPDPNFDYELDVKMPGLMEELEIYQNNLMAIADEITELCGTSPAMTATLYSDAQVLEAMMENVRELPEDIGLLTTIQGNVNDASGTLQSQTLGLDWICFQSPDEELSEPQVSVFDTMKVMVSDFVSSFEKEEEKQEENAIDVWISRDSEWGNMLQRMIAEEFEPKYGIKVNLNILPSGNTTVSGTSPLLLSVISGKTPDLALGCDTDSPIELAIRGQLTDLSQFPDYTEISDRFADTAIRTLSYEDGCYGLPETMEIPIMVYRTDVFEQNDLEVPQTWEELWRQTLPQLAQIDGNFYMGNSDVNMYANFLHQNGGEFYDEDGNCTLNTDAAIKAFEQWTKCFVQYNIPQSASFYNEMRTGKLPIGICSLADYMQLMTYAGELTGKLAIAPIPGTEQEDGKIVRYGAGSLSSAIMFENSEKKEESWTFLKWWTSTEVQKRFASGVEARVGATGRWFSANLEAFYALPWEAEDLEVVKEWMPWYKNTYNVLGGYYTSRSISNAWTRTVLSGELSRDSIEQSYEEISLQIERKKKEYE